MDLTLVTLFCSSFPLLGFEIHDVLQHPGLNSEDIKIITVPVSDSTFVDFITGGPDVEYDRSPLLGACNSHNKPMQRHFYRLVYF